MSDFHRKDLEEAIKAGSPPKWTFYIQVIAEKDEHNFDFDILDATKVWPIDEVPLIPIGELCLNRCVDEFFPETEQVAFCTSHVVPGIGFSNDPLLQGRNFSYFDTQISRLGINWEQLPINRPVCPVFNHNRDGRSQHRINKSTVNYHPNREQEVRLVPPSEGGYAEYMEKVIGIKQRVRTAKFQEHYNQAQMFYHSLTPYEKQHLINAFCFELSHCDDERVYKRYTDLLNKIDFDLATTVARKVNGVVPDKPAREIYPKRDAYLSQTFFAPKEPTIASRRIAILIADGFNETEVQGVRAMLAGAKATCWLIGPRRSLIYYEGQTIGSGTGLVADHHFEDQRSTMFDAVYVPSGAEHAKTLLKTGRAIHWIREAFAHCKAIGAIGDGASVVAKALDTVEQLQFNLNRNDDSVTSTYGVVTAGRYSLSSAATDSLKIGPGEEGFVANFAFEISKHRCFERELEGLTDSVAY